MQRRGARRASPLVGRRGDGDAAQALQRAAGGGDGGHAGGEGACAQVADEGGSEGGGGGGGGGGTTATASSGGGGQRNSRVWEAITSLPILASVAAVIVASTPPLGRLFFTASNIGSGSGGGGGGDEPILGVLIDTLLMLRGAFIPSVAIVLGSNLAESQGYTATPTLSVPALPSPSSQPEPPQHQELGAGSAEEGAPGPVIAAVTVGRFVIVPGCCLVLEQGLFNAGLLGAAVRNEFCCCRVLLLLLLLSMFFLF